MSILGQIDTIHITIMQLITVTTRESHRSSIIIRCQKVTGTVAVPPVSPAEQHLETENETGQHRQAHTGCCRRGRGAHAGYCPYFTLQKLSFGAAQTPWLGTLLVAYVSISASRPFSLPREICFLLSLMLSPLRRAVPAAREGLWSAVALLGLL